MLIIIMFLVCDLALHYSYTMVDMMYIYVLTLWANYTMIMLAMVYLTCYGYYIVIRISIVVIAC